MKIENQLVENKEIKRLLTEVPRLHLAVIGEALPPGLHVLL